MKTVIETTNADNIIALLANIFYVVAFFIYTYEVKKDSNTHKTIPFLTHPINSEATRLLS